MDNKDLYEGFADRYDLAPGKLDEHNPLMVEFFRQIFSENRIQLDIFHSPERNESEVWRAELTVLLMDDQERLLKLAGFQRVDFYGDFDFSPYVKSSSDCLITVAHKKFWRFLRYG
jgi:hypothetical protein